LEKQDPGRKQSRDTGSIGKTGPRTKTIQRHWHNWTNKKQDEGNPQTLVTLFRVFPMLPVSLDCLRPVSCVPNVTSFSGLFSFCFLFVQCYQCLWIVLVLFLVCPMLPVSRDCLRPVFYLSNVTSVCGLPSSCFLFVQWYQCLWINW
jgi:hypothetical protein